MNLVPQPISPTQYPVADEAAYIGVDDRYGGAITTVTWLEQDRQCGELGVRLEANQVYGAAYTKLIKKVKKLEKAAKSSQARRRARIVISNDEDDLEDHVTPPNRVPSDLASGGVTSMAISSTKHKE
ncbi:hypothetical protein Tco_1262236 [Tanacetum coccineum]